jgi:alpha-tubulin suppressor-like RCC1 family protein
MPNPITNFRDSNGVDLGNKLITKEYLMSVYPQIANQLITPELWVWGAGSSGALGDNTIILKSTPVTSSAGGANWKQVSAGANYTSAIKTDGTLWVWGAGANGRLGNNSIVNISTPVTTFAGGTNWKQVSCGYFHTAAIKTDGTLWIWGSGSGGKLGINNIIDVSTPVTTFAGGNNWKQVSTGRQHIAAIKTDGTLWVWGTNNFGALGIGNVTTPRCTPVTTFAGGTNWKQVSVGGDAPNTGHTAAIKTDGTLWIWGGGGNGQLGTNNASSRCTPVTTFAGGTNWKQVCIGESFTTATKRDGTLWTWGYNFNGQLGNNSAVDRSTPVTTFAGGNNWNQVNCGYYFTAAIKTDGTLWTWGSASSGRLGNNVGGSSNVSTPVTTFAGGTNWKQVDCGFSHMAAIKTSDDLQGI